MLKIFNLFLILLVVGGCFIPPVTIDVKVVEANGEPIGGVLIHLKDYTSFIPLDNRQSFFSETDSFGNAEIPRTFRIDSIALVKKGYIPIGRYVESDFRGGVFVMEQVTVSDTMRNQLPIDAYWCAVHSKSQVTYLKKWFDYNPDTLEFQAKSVEKEIKIEQASRYDSIPIMTGDINHPTWLNAMIYKITKSGDLEVCMSSGVSKEKDFQVIFIGKTGYYPYICIKNIPSHIYLKKIGETKACQIISREFIDSFLPENIDTNQAYNFAWWEYYKKGIISENDSRYYRISGMN